MPRLGRRIELAALVALALFLPIFEAPKTLAWFAYVAVWLINRYRARDYGGRWDSWDTLIACWILSGFLAAAFAGVQAGEWHGALDLLRYGSVLLLLKRSSYSRPEAKVMLASLIASALIGLGMAYSRLEGGAGTLELNSVGNVNHTAIYLAIVFGVATSWALAGSFFAAAIAGVLLFSVFFTSSRAAVFVALALMMALAAVRQTSTAKRVALVLVVIAALSAIAKPDVWQKQVKMMASQDVLAHRGGVWRIAFDAWLDHPIFGVGMTNLAVVTRDQAKEARLALGSRYDATVHFDVGHAHSLYLNTLAERGLVGTGALMTFLIVLGASLVRHRPHADGAGDDFLLWGAATSGYVVTVVVGVANTTLHHEHGLLAMFLIGLWLPHRVARKNGSQHGQPPGSDTGRRTTDTSGSVHSRSEPSVKQPPAPAMHRGRGSCR
jgi:O-antigen ligase